MVIDEEDFLEHYGVKGMRWGVRRSKSSGSEQSPRQKKVKQERNRMIRNAALGTAGAGVAAYLIAKNSNKKIGLATKEVNVDKHLHNAARLRRSLSQNKPPKVKVTNPLTSAASRDLAKLKAQAAASVREANEMLRAMDNKLDIPFPERSYLKEWT